MSKKTLTQTEKVSNAVKDMLLLYKDAMIKDNPWHKVEYRQAICDCLCTLKWHRILKDYNLATGTFELN